MAAQHSSAPRSGFRHWRSFPSLLVLLVLLAPGSALATPQLPAADQLWLQLELDPRQQQLAGRMRYTPEAPLHGRVEFWLHPDLELSAVADETAALLADPPPSLRAYLG